MSELEARVTLVLYRKKFYFRFQGADIIDVNNKIQEWWNDILQSGYLHQVSKNEYTVYPPHAVRRVDINYRNPL